MPPQRTIPTLLGPMSIRRFAIRYVQLVFGYHMFMEYFGEVSLTRGPSMLPTLNPRGDWVWIDKTARRGRGIQTGDIVTIKHPLMPDERASKRVIGMPGDYVLRDTPSSSANGASTMIQVPEGHVWLAGDNLPWSRDSREYGPVPLALVRGKVVARIWPLNQAGWLRNTFVPVAG